MQKYGKFLNWQRNREYFFKKNFLLDVLPVQVGNLRGYIERIGLFVEFFDVGHRCAGYYHYCSAKQIGILETIQQLNASEIPNYSFCKKGFNIFVRTGCWMYNMLLQLNPLYIREFYPVKILQPFSQPFIFSDNQQKNG